jgi:hypothetical protein
VLEAALEAHTWYFIGIGGIYMLYSVIAAGASRAPKSFSISLVPFDFDLSGQRRHVVAESRVMLALFTVEMTFLGVGRWMCKTFSSGNVTEEEQAFWTKALGYEVTKYPLSEGSGKVNRKASELTSILDRQIAELGPRREEATREAPISNAAEVVIVEQVSHRDPTFLTEGAPKAMRLHYYNLISFISAL